MDGRTIMEKTGIGHRLSAIERKMEFIKSFLVKIEKVVDDRLAKRNLGDEKMGESSALDLLQQYLREDAKAAKNQKEEIQASGAIASHVGGSPKSIVPILEQNQPMNLLEEKIVLTTQKIKIPVLVSEPEGVMVYEKVAEETGLPISVENLVPEEQLVEQKETDAERSEPVCQVFDQMGVRRTGSAKKKKKKRWKASLETQEGLERPLSSEEKGKASPGCERIRNGFGVSGKQGDVNKEVYACQVFDKRSREKKRATRKRKRTKSTKAGGSKYKCGNVNPRSCQNQEEYKFRKQHNKSPMKRCKLVNGLVSYKHQVFGKKFMRMITKKRKKRTRLEEHERKVIKHELVFAKLLREHKTILKKLARWKKHKFKQKHNKQIVNLGNPKSEPELFEKGFNEWFKKKQGYERAYSRDDKLLQPSGLAMQNRGLLAAKKRRDQFRHKHKKKKSCKEGSNEKLIHWLYWIWLLLFTQRKKNRKRRKKHVESQTRTREILCVVEMERCSWERLVKLGKVRDKDDLSLCLEIGPCGNVELDNTKMNLVKSMGCKDLPKYLEREASLGRELMERGGNKRACALSLGNEITRAALEGKNKSLIWDDCDAERHDCEHLVILLKLSSPYGEVTSTHIVC